MTSHQQFVANKNCVKGQINYIIEEVIHIYQTEWNRTITYMKHIEK